MRIINKTYNINSKLNKKICLISDLHYSNKKDVERLYCVLDNIKKLNPDYICIPGDITNKSEIDDEDIFVKWIGELSKITKVIVSIGNHEFYINKRKNIFGLNKKLLKKISSLDNVYLLDNDSVVIDNINFIGLTLTIDCYYEKDKLIKSINKLNINNKNYNVLLCHCPEDICDTDILKQKNINLVLCGHMHGGIVPKILRSVFKNRGLISPRKTLFPKYAYGYVRNFNTDIIITSGIKVLHSNQLAKLFRPEVVIINLKK